MDNNHVEEIKRHFDVVAEGLMHEISLVAEGHEVTRREANTFRDEMKAKFREVKSLIKFSYAELDQRIRTLEQEVADSKSRLEKAAVSTSLPHPHTRNCSQDDHVTRIQFLMSMFSTKCSLL